MTLGTSNSAGTRFFSSGFMQSLWEESLQLDNLTIVQYSTLEWWKYWISQLSTFTQFLEKIWLTFVSSSSFFSKHGMLTIFRHSHLEYWAFPQHYHSAILICSISLLFILLTIVISAFNPLRLLFKPLISLGLWFQNNIS